MARKKKHPEHVNHERWLVSYADFMTLLFAFFTSLYAISNVDAKKANKMQASTQKAFNVDVLSTTQSASGIGPGTIDASVPKPKKKSDSIYAGKGPSAKRHNIDTKPKTVKDVFHELQGLIKKQNLGEGVGLSMIKNDVILTLKDKAFFETGSAHIRPEALPFINTVAEAIFPTQLPIRINGYTDDVPPTGDKFTSNWDLSSERAVSVVEYFAQEYGYPPASMTIGGMGSTHPIGDNKTPEGRSKNRRIDIILLGNEEP